MILGEGGGIRGGFKVQSTGGSFGEIPLKGR